MVTGALASFVLLPAADVLLGRDLTLETEVLLALTLHGHQRVDAAVSADLIHLQSAHCPCVSGASLVIWAKWHLILTLL